MPRGSSSNPLSSPLTLLSTVINVLQGKSVLQIKALS